MPSSNAGARSPTGLQSCLTEYQGNAPTMTAASPSSNTKCIPCQKSFKRPEHLRRHQKSHHGGGGYTCSTCGKQFARRLVHPYRCSDSCPTYTTNTDSASHNSDVLVRHEFIHSASRAATPRAKRPRACEACARAREKCSRGEPCQRCSVRAIRCEYRQRNEISSAVFDTTIDRGADGHDDTALEPWVGMEGDMAPLIEAAAPSQSLYHHLPDAIPNITLGMNWLPASHITGAAWPSILELQLQSPGRPNAIAVDAAAHHGQITALSPAETSSPVSAMSNQSTSTNSSHSRSQQGKLYATSSSARAPVYEAEKELVPEIPGAHPQEPISRLSECRHSGRGQADAWHSTPTSIRDLQPPHSSQDVAPSRLIWEPTYQLIVAECHGLRLGPTGGNQPAFSVREDFPTLPQMNMLIGLFYSGFLPSLPVLHGSLSSANDYWILTLAMATIGCQYTKTKDFDRIVPFMHQLLAKALAETDIVWVEPHLQLFFVQALLLSQIGLYYYGLPCMRAQAVARRGYLIYCANTLGLLGPVVSSGPTLNLESDLTARWHGWILDETKRRLGYSIWVRLCF
jgi:hypothetical protein